MYFSHRVGVYSGKTHWIFLHDYELHTFSRHLHRIHTIKTPGTRTFRPLRSLIHMTLTQVLRTSEACLLACHRRERGCL